MQNATQKKLEPVRRSENVVYLPAPLDDLQRLLDGARAGERTARGELFDHFAKQVERLLYRLLGPDSEIRDLVQEVFIQVFTSLPKFRGDAKSLRAWINRITVFTARGAIRRRRARAWLHFVSPDDLSAEAPSELPPEVRQVLARGYGVLEKLPANERIALTLKYVVGMSLDEIADSCDVSRPTIIRRLARGRERFMRQANLDPVVREWIEEENHEA